MPRNPFIIGIKQPKINLGFGRSSSREPVPAKVKNTVKKRAKNTCEYRGCNHKSNLQFHHKNMKNSDNRVSNIELLCPNHHAKRTEKKRRIVVSKNMITGEKITRLVKRNPKNKKAKKKPRSTNPFGIKPIKLPRLIL
ncbi:MAG: hypothetical protein AABX40_04635 [Candidatus Hydrothermarchaeota archaeon]